MLALFFTLWEDIRYMFSSIAQWSTIWIFFLDRIEWQIRWHLLFFPQIFGQPVFAFAERWFINRFPNSWFVNNYYTNKHRWFPSFQINPLKICFRTAYVATTTAIAMMFPYFNQVLGVLGALNFWPLAIYFPVEMCIVQKKIQSWTRKWVVLKSFSFVCLLVTIVAFIGSIQGLINAKFECDIIVITFITRLNIILLIEIKF